MSLAAGVAAAVLGGSAVQPTSGAGAPERHVVRPGDTLWAIATERYEGDPREVVWRIRERNGLESALLQPGQVLDMPPPP